MKKPLMIVVLFMLVTAVSFAQTTTNSTNPNSSTSNKKNPAERTEPRKGPESGTSESNAQSATTRSGSSKHAKTSTGNAGGATRAQVNDKTGVGKKPGSGSQAAAKTQPTLPSQGAINQTEPDTIVKKGSGTSPRNRKNKTGKTNNYNNEATKRNNK